MIPLAGLMGLVGPSGTAPAGVTFRSAGAMLISGSTTTLAPAVPVSALAADLLVAVIMRRSAVASDPPAGWTLVSATSGATEGTVTQYVQVYTKTATGSEAGGTVTFSQAATGRMIAQILAISAPTGTPLFDSQATSVVSSTDVSSISIPTLSSSAEGRLGIAATSIISVSVSDPSVWTADGGWSIRSPNTLTDARLAIFTKSLNTGDSTTATATNNRPAGGITGLTANALIFAPP